MNIFSHINNFLSFGDYCKIKFREVLKIHNKYKF